jgi:hypothetical protein
MAELIIDYYYYPFHYVDDFIWIFQISDERF